MDTERIEMNLTPYSSLDAYLNEHGEDLESTAMLENDLEWEEFLENDS